MSPKRRHVIAIGLGLGLAATRCEEPARKDACPESRSKPGHPFLIGFKPDLRCGPTTQLRFDVTRYCISETYCFDQWCERADGVRQGTFTTEDRHGRLFLQGEYHAGKKDGLWCKQERVPLKSNNYKDYIPMIEREYKESMTPIRYRMGEKVPLSRLDSCPY